MEEEAHSLFSCCVFLLRSCLHCVLDFTGEFPVVSGIGGVPDAELRSVGPPVEAGFSRALCAYPYRVLHIRRQRALSALCTDEGPFEAIPRAFQVAPSPFVVSGFRAAVGEVLLCGPCFGCVRSRVV